MPVTKDKANRHINDEYVPTVAFLIASLLMQTTLLLGFFLSYPSPKPESDNVAEKAVFFDSNTCNLSETYG